MEDMEHENYDKNLDSFHLNHNLFNESSGEEMSFEEWSCINNIDPQLAQGDEGSDNIRILSEFHSKINGQNISDLELNGKLTCKRMWDGLLCWPEAVEGQAVTLQCFSQFNNIHYDTSKNVTRYCEEGGFWENTTNYSSCVPLLGTHKDSESEEGLGITIHVYFFGYCISIVALLIAIIIFLSFNATKLGPILQKSGPGRWWRWQNKSCGFPTSSISTQTMRELRCLRNKIHTHLMVTYIMSGTLWIITSFTTRSSVNNVNTQFSCVIFVLLHYFHLTNFFWMFVEGLYLYVLVVQTFMADNIRLRVYAVLGWGVPLVVVLGWSVTKLLTEEMGHSGDRGLLYNNTTGLGESDQDGDFIVPCIGFTENIFDWIYKVPFIIVLLLNIVFLARIMWVLITKLRSATSPDTQQSRKAAKALIVLMPLLGITYLLFITGPKKLLLYDYLRALLISTQGFVVALLYCFLNGEVRIAVRHRWNRLNSYSSDSSSCGSKFVNVACCCCCYCIWNRQEGRRRHLQHVRDWSPRSRTESIRLHTSTSHTFGKRASSSVGIGTHEGVSLSHMFRKTSANNNGGKNITTLSTNFSKRLSKSSLDRIYTIPD